MGTHESAEHWPASTALGGDLKVCGLVTHCELKLQDDLLVAIQAIDRGVVLVDEACITHNPLHTVVIIIIIV